MFGKERFFWTCGPSHIQTRHCGLFNCLWSQGCLLTGGLTVPGYSYVAIIVAGRTTAATGQAITGHRSTYVQSQARPQPPFQGLWEQEEGKPWEPGWQGLYPQNICDLFTVDCYSYNLRRSEFTLPRFNTFVPGKHFLEYRGPKLWNMLPGKLRNRFCIQSSKMQVRTKELKSLLDYGYPTVSSRGLCLD